MSGKEIRFNLGNLNNYQIGKKAKTENTETSPKTSEPVPVAKGTETAKTNDINLNLDMNALLGLHLTKTAQKVDTSKEAVSARAAEFYASADFQALNKEFGIYDDVDPAIGQYLSPTTLSYIAKTPAEVRERIGNNAVKNFNDIAALA